MLNYPFTLSQLSNMNRDQLSFQDKATRTDEELEGLPPKPETNDDRIYRKKEEEQNKKLKEDFINKRNNRRLNK